MTYEKCPVCCDTIAAPKSTTPVTVLGSGLINAYQGGMSNHQSQYQKSSVANFLLKTTRGATRRID